MGMGRLRSVCTCVESSMWLLSMHSLTRRTASCRAVCCAPSHSSAPPSHPSAPQSHCLPFPQFGIFNRLKLIEYGNKIMLQRQKEWLDELAKHEQSPNATGGAHGMEVVAAHSS